jgi:hypothetical protein
MKEPELVVVYVSAGPLAAEVIKGKLESAGIPAMLKSEARNTFPFTIDGMGQVEVLVSKQNEARARELVKGEND